MKRWLVAGGLALVAWVGVSVVGAALNQPSGAWAWRTWPSTQSPQPLSYPRRPRPQAPVPDPQPLSGFNAVRNANGEVIRIYRRDPNDPVLSITAPDGSSDEPVSGTDGPKLRQMYRDIYAAAAAAGAGR